MPEYLKPHDSHDGTRSLKRAHVQDVVSFFVFLEIGCGVVTTPTAATVVVVGVHDASSI